MAEPPEEHNVGLSAAPKTADNGEFQRQEVEHTPAPTPASSVESGLAKEQMAPQVEGVTWNGELDDYNPLNWSPGKKW